jgi:hypothetical protein
MIEPANRIKIQEALQNIRQSLEGFGEFAPSNEWTHDHKLKANRLMFINVVGLAFESLTQQDFQCISNSDFELFQKEFAKYKRRFLLARKEIWLDGNLNRIEQDINNFYIRSEARTSLISLVNELTSSESLRFLGSLELFAIQN